MLFAWDLSLAGILGTLIDKFNTVPNWKFFRAKLSHFVMKTLRLMDRLQWIENRDLFDHRSSTESSNFQKRWISHCQPRRVSSSLLVPRTTDYIRLRTERAKKSLNVAFNETLFTTMLHLHTGRIMRIIICLHRRECKKRPNCTARFSRFENTVFKSVLFPRI